MKSESLNNGIFLLRTDHSMHFHAHQAGVRSRPALRPHDSLFALILHLRKAADAILPITHRLVRGRFQSE
jgi:hypothetical protein